MSLLEIIICAVIGAAVLGYGIYTIVKICKKKKARKEDNEYE